MKLLFLALTLTFTFNQVFSQSENKTADKIFLHNGSKIEGTVLKVDAFTVLYKYLGEDVEIVVGKYAVNKIVYKSGREEVISEKITVLKESDWEKVIIIENEAGIAGLVKVGEVKGKTATINYRSANGSEKVALEKLKKQAAAIGSPFILMTFDRQTTTSFTLGGSNNQKKGIAYRY